MVRQPFEGARLLSANATEEGALRALALLSILEPHTVTLALVSK